MAVFLASVLAVGVLLTPSAAGVGTHAAFGLPPCGMLVATGHPCPTCGVTTSFALAAHGRFHASFVNQPFGFIVFAVTLGGLLLTATMAVTARSCVALLTPYAVVTFFMTMLVLALVSWAYKWAVM